MTMQTKTFTISILTLFLIIITWSGQLLAVNSDSEQTDSPILQEYTVQPGDLLEISVWKEEDMTKDVLVRPDGGISFPLAGEIYTGGKTISQLQSALTKKLSTYLSNPVVTVSPKQLLGNRVYVISKVAKPGMYLISSYIDVVQALSMAGELTPFSAANDIRILRRSKDGTQSDIKFRYGDIEDGDKLKQNILLQSGDTVVVP